jgi:polysaccharide biosynthesis/export protein
MGAIGWRIPGRDVRAPAGDDLRESIADHRNACNMKENLDWDTALRVETSSPGQQHQQHSANGDKRQSYADSQRRSMKDDRQSGAPRGPAPVAASIDAWTFTDLLFQRLSWLVAGGLIMGGLAAAAGMFVWKSSHTAVAELMRYQPMGMGDFFKPPEVTPDTFAGWLKAPELLQRVSTNALPPVSAEVLAKAVFIKTDPDSDLVRVAVRGTNAEQVVDLANLYAREAVQYMRDLQSRDAEQINKDYLKQELADMDGDITSLQQEFKGLPNSVPLASKLHQIGGTVSNLNVQLQTSPRVSMVTARLSEKLQAAIDDLSTLTRRYTDANPLVQQQREQIQSLQQQISEAVTNPVANGPGMRVMPGAGSGAFDPVYDIIRAKLQALDDSRQRLVDRQREAQAFAANPPGNVRPFAPATIKGVMHNRRWLKIGVVTFMGGVFGLFFASGGVLLVEFVDDRLKSADDLKRVTRLPVIATLGDLNKQGPSARERWAFRTWTMLQGRLSPSPARGLICGITSSQPGDGRSTWINLLAEAASLTGFRVLTIATRPAGDEAEAGEHPQINGHQPEEPSDSSVNGDNALTTSVLSSPAEVTEQLAGPNPQPMVHIPLPGWVWNLERRSQWQQALDHWRKIDNVVILVELPAATSPEAVLLGQNLPNLIWLANCGSSRAGETRAQLETMRHGRCRFVGAVLNNESARPLRSRFPRWISCVAIGAVAWALSASRLAAYDWPVPASSNLAMATPQAAPTPAATQGNTPPEIPPAAAGTSTNSVPPLEPAPLPATAEVSSNGTFSVVSRGERAPWQQRLTLGPGDILNFSLYGQPDLTKNDVFLAPDGTISYLEAQNVQATGLTIDELRTNLDNELSKYRRAPRTVITPVLYLSKKYYMLGKVVQRGIYALDRPTTIVEAVARAKGLEIGIADRETLELADFQKSFLMRHGKRIPIDFVKLFEQGDLSQNISLEPDDYLYFPPAGLKEVYVLGEVGSPGVVAYNSELTVIGALSARGGFNSRAYKSRVMIIRGSLSAPKAFVVDTRAILDAREQDFKLQSHDIIFVSSRPFIQVEDLLDVGITAFIQSVTAEWAGKNVGPLITHPIFTSP